MAHHPRLPDADRAEKAFRLHSSLHKLVTLHLHSQTLRRCQCIAWGWGHPIPLYTIEITLPDGKHVAACTSCIDPTFFTSVRDALEVLEQAAEFVFDDLVNACLCYLEGVKWSAEDETLIRSSLASLDVKIPVDLADRLSSSGRDRAKMMEDRPTEMLSQVSLTSFESSSRIRTYIETQVRKNVHPAVPAVLGSVNEAILYKEWNRNLYFIRTKQFSMVQDEGVVDMVCRLEWLLLTLLSLKIGVDVVKTLAQEDTAKLLVEYSGRIRPLSPAYMLKYIMKAFENGELIISRPIRLALVKTWLPIMHDIMATAQNVEQLANDLQESFRAVIKTLPQADQTEIFVTWFSTCFRTTQPWPNLEEVFELSCDELRQAQDT